MTRGRRIQRVAENALVAVLILWAIALFLFGPQLLVALERVLGR